MYATEKLFDILQFPFSKHTTLDFFIIETHNFLSNCNSRARVFSNVELRKSEKYRIETLHMFVKICVGAWEASWAPRCATCLQIIFTHDVSYRVHCIEATCNSSHREARILFLLMDASWLHTLLLLRNTTLAFLTAGMALIFEDEIWIHPTHFPLIWKSSAILTCKFHTNSSLRVNHIAILLGYFCDIPSSTCIWLLAIVPDFLSVPELKFPSSRNIILGP